MGQCRKLRSGSKLVPAECPVARGDRGRRRRGAASLLSRPEVRVAIEAETRLRDMQALLRRIEMKRRDSGIGRVIVVPADACRNRAAVAAAASILGVAFVVGARTTLAALKAGRDPGADCLLFA
jgi:hypothetical protein